MYVIIMQNNITSDHIEHIFFNYYFTFSNNKHNNIMIDDIDYNNNIERLLNLIDHSCYFLES